MKQTTLDLYHVELKDIQKSKAWFDAKIKAMAKTRVTPQAMLGRDSGMVLTTRLIPTKMYAFSYMPLGKDTLPYYDTFPLIFPLSRTPDTFMGLNMHYLDYPLRFALFRALLKISANSNITDASKMRISWAQISGLASTPQAQACIKQYRYDHVKSVFLEIMPTDWATAMMLPTHRFVGASPQAIWQESTKIGRNW